MNVASNTRNRVVSIDALRGFVMVIMALDHVRDFFHITAMTADPLDIVTTTPLLFVTRWITHFCAPVFVFLAGTSAYLMGQKRTKQQLSIFLIKRGLWLMAAEIIIMSFVLTFNPSYNIIILQVIWVIGCSMILLGLLIHLSIRAVLVVGLILLLGHNTFDLVTIPTSGASSVLLNLFVTGRAAFYPLSATHTVAILYKILPWTAVMILGYCIGYFFEADVPFATRRRALITIGSAAILFFVALRFANIYGDPSPWQHQKTGFDTVLSFINTSKYPPSLLFICMTLGPSLIVLAAIDAVKGKAAAFFTTYGRVPFFYFVVHFFLIHTLCVLLFYLGGYNNSQISESNSLFFFRPSTFGYSLPIVYGIWLLIVGVMYPLCRWYNRYKSTHTFWWLSYL